MIYWIPQSSNQGVYRSVLKYNNINRQSFGTTKYRKEIFSKIINYVQSLEGINNIILGGDLNQNIESAEVKAFYS